MPIGVYPLSEEEVVALDELDLKAIRANLKMGLPRFFCGLPIIKADKTDPAYKFHIALFVKSVIPVVGAITY